MRNRLGERHAIAFEARRQYKKISSRIERGETLRRDHAGDDDPIGEIETRDVAVEARRRVAFATARRSSAPGPVAASALA